jgi:hypothetical protein
MVCDKWHRDSSKTVNLQPTNFTDPVQGTASDCALIAAISSILWIYGRTKPLIIDSVSGYITNPPEDPPKEFEVTFYNPQKSIYVNDYLPWDGAKFCFATTRNQPNELWPGIYEKAYGDFCECVYHSESPHDQPNNWVDQPAQWLPPMIANPNPPPQTITNPNPPWPGGGTPLTHLVRYTQKLSIYTEKKDITAIKSDLKPLCITNGQAKVAAVANSKWPAPAGIPNYITENHTYSFLGLYPSQASPTAIVLRNPKGEGIGINPDKKAFSNSLPVDSGDGILTISLADFLSYFYSLEYIKI